MKNAPIRIALCALFVALTAILSQFSIPIGPVPINLATFSVYVAGGVLGASAGAVSQLVYVLLGAFGLPVFAQFSGGIGVIAGPTGGYLAGYIASAWLVGLLTSRLGRKPVFLVVSLLAGTALCYLLGTAWFMFSTKTGLWQSLLLCVVPFLIGDAVKIAAAAVLIPRLRLVRSRMEAGRG